MRKRKILFLMMLLFLISGCGKKTPAETLPVETAPAVEETEAAAPELEYGTAQVDGIPVILKTLSRGDVVDVVGIYDEIHYILKLDSGYGLVDRNLIRLASEPEFEEWTGYAYHNAEVFDNYRLSGAAAKKLKADDQVQVLEDLGWCYLIEQEGTTGYMQHESLAKKPGSSQKKGGSASENGGSSQSSGKENSDGFVGEDGGEISLQASAQITMLATFVPQEGKVSGKAIILADETQVILGYFDRNDKIPYLKESEGECLTVYLDGLYATVSQQYVCTDTEKAYEPWNGRSLQIAPIYNDFWMLGSPSDLLNANSTITVLYELDDCYLVEVDGVTGYMAKDDVVSDENPVPQETAPSATKPKVPAETVPKQDTGGSDAAKPTESTNPTESTKPTEAEKPTVPQDNTDENEKEDNSDKETVAPDKEDTNKTDPEWTPPIL